jgi:hypothetical protein
LNPNYLPIHRQATEHSGNDDTAKKKDLDRISRDTKTKAPHQPGGEKPVVQALIRR